MQLIAEMYNSRVSRSTFYLVCSALLLASCNRAPENKDAVKQGVIEHLTKNSGLDLGSMNVEVTNVTFTGNEAKAAISFQPKGSVGEGMSMDYTLLREGRKWVVQKKAGSGAHADVPAPAGALPPGHPPLEGGSSPPPQR